MNETIFNIEFSEFIPLYNGLIAVFIGDGTSPDIRETVDPITGETTYSGGVAGYLYAKYHDGFWQSVGFISDYEEAKAYFEDLGITFTYPQWIAMIAAMPENALKSEGYAVGKQNGQDVSSGEFFHNNSKYYKEQASESASDAQLAQTRAENAQSSASTSASLANEAKVKAENAVIHYPRINNNDYWEVWDVMSETWYDTGRKSKAEAVTTYAYQSSSSGTTVPTGSWSTSIQPVKGQYLWTRVTHTWNNGNTDTIYSVSYSGVDGALTVNGLSGNVILDGKNVNVDDSAATTESIYSAISRLDNVITNNQIDALFT